MDLCVCVLWREAGGSSACLRRRDDSGTKTEGSDMGRFGFEFQGLGCKGWRQADSSTRRLFSKPPFPCPEKTNASSRSGWRKKGIKYKRKKGKQCDSLQPGSSTSARREKTREEKRDGESRSKARGREREHREGAPFWHPRPPCAHGDAAWRDPPCQRRRAT